jgi:hypothetical protein
MAITINQQPISGVFAGSPMVYAVSSNNSGNAGFKYVADVFIWFGNSASVPVSYTYRLIKRKESVSNLYGYFDVSNIVSSYLSQTNIDHAAGTATDNEQTVCNVVVKFREFTTAGGTGAVSATSNTIQAYDGYSEFVDGVNYANTNGILTSGSSIQYIQQDQAMTIGVTPLHVTGMFVEYSDGQQAIIDIADLGATYSTDSTDWMYFLPAGVANLNDSVIDPKPQDVADLQYYDLSLGNMTTINYARRVIGDGGVCEGLVCLENALQELGNDDAAYTTRLYPTCEPRYTPITIAYQNKYGAWDYIVAFKKSVESTRTDKKRYTTNIGTIGSSTWTYDPTTASPNKTYNNFGTDSITLNTGFLNDGYNQMVKEMLLSNSVYLVEEERYVILNDTQVEYKTSLNDNLVQYTFNMTYAAQVKNRVWL